MQSSFFTASVAKKINVVPETYWTFFKCPLKASEMVWVTVLLCVCLFYHGLTESPRNESMRIPSRWVIAEGDRMFLKTFPTFFKGFCFVQFVYLCRPSEATTWCCVIPGGIWPQDWQILPCAGEEPDFDPSMLTHSKWRWSLAPCWLSQNVEWGFNWTESLRRDTPRGLSQWGMIQFSNISAISVHKICSASVPLRRQVI